MYKFIIKDIVGMVIHTSVCTKRTVSEAQEAGLAFIRVRGIMDNAFRLPIGANVDVVSA